MTGPSAVEWIVVVVRSVAISDCAPSRAVVFRSVLSSPRGSLVKVWAGGSGFGSAAARCASEYSYGVSFETVAGSGPAAAMVMTVFSVKAQVKYRVTDGGSPGRDKRQRRRVPSLPAVGERKAARTRIVLSNTNALPVRDLENLSVANLAQEERVGSILGLDDALLEQLRDAKLFKRAQNWNLFQRPATLVRGETVDLGRVVQQINQASDSQKPAVRQLIAGPRQSGKSVLLLQVASMAYTSKWVVVDVPDAIDHVNNHHSYNPLSATEDNSPHRSYVQPSLTAGLLSRLVYSNEAVLQALQPQTTPPDSLFAKPAKTLADVAHYGADHPAQSWPVFTYLMSELTQPGRPPLLVAIDGLDHWMGPSHYRNSDYDVIHSHQFTLVKYFLDALFNNNSLQLPNGGLVLAATTASNTPDFPTFSILLQQIAALNNGLQPSSPLFPLPAPYQKLDTRVSSLLDTATAANTTITQLHGLSKPETRGLLDYFMKSGLLRDAVNDNLVSELWSLSGCGNVGDLCKLAVRARIDASKVLTTFGTSEGIRRGQGEHIPKSARK
ncbi:hypothetical protein DV736_g3525, partial [Chaetothyriales sp. CBS 134916]